MKKTAVNSETVTDFSVEDIEQKPSVINGKKYRFTQCAYDTDFLGRSMVLEYDSMLDFYNEYASRILSGEKLTLFEYFREGQYTKFYLDYDDSTLTEPVTEEVRNYHIVNYCLPEIRKILCACRSLEMERLILSEYCREGDGFFVKDGKTGYKVSIRFMINIKIQYSEILTVLKKLDIKYFDRSVYGKTSQKLNMFGCYKFDKKESQRFVPSINGKIETMENVNLDYFSDFIAQDIEDEKKLINTDFIFSDDDDNLSVYSQSSTNSNRSNEEYKYKVKNLHEAMHEWALNCPNVECDDDRINWLKVLSFFKKNDLPHEYFDKWSQKHSKYNYRDDVKKWKEFNRFEWQRINLGFICNYFKNADENMYKLWYKKHFNYMETEPENEFFISQQILNGTILEIAQVVHKEIMKKAVYCNNEWYIYSDKEKIWKFGIKPTTVIVKTINKFFEWNITYISNKLQNGPNKDLEIARSNFITMKKKMDTPSNCSQFTEHLKTLNCNDKFKEQLDNLKGKIAYQNGIYDIETDTFREGIFYEDFLTFYLPFDFKRSSPDNKERVKQIILKINSMEYWKYEYYIKALGYSLTGYADREQVSFFCIGMTAGNGKSTIFEALTSRMPGYVNKMKSDVFSITNSKRHKFLDDIQTNRIIWLNEVAKQEQDIDFIKDFSDGRTFKNEIMHGTNKDIKVNGKLFFVSNGLLKFSSDEGIKRRYRYIEFQSKFFENENDFENYENKDSNRHFMKDSTVGPFLESDEGITALLEILFEGARLYFKDGLKTPIIYDELKKEAIKENDMYEEFISDFFVEEEGKHIYKGELDDLWNLSGCKGKFNLDQCLQKMKTKGYIYDPKKQKKILGRVKTGCFLNIKFVDNDDE